MKTTKDLIFDYVYEHRDDFMTTKGISKQLGISYQTAKKYLIELERCGILDIKLAYGYRGRPEHLYYYCGGLKAEP